MSTVNFELVRQSLKELSSKEMQIRLWMSDAGEISSFVEAVEGLFDDSGLVIALERDRAKFLPDALLLFGKLDEEIGLVDADTPPQRVIESKQMDAVRRTASQLLKFASFVR
jgi:hypothetical protein